MFKINIKFLFRFTPIIFNILPAFFIARFLGPKVFAEYNLVFVLVTLTTNIFIVPFGLYLNKNSIKLYTKKILSYHLFFFLKYNLFIYLLLSILLYFSGYLIFLKLSVFQYLFFLFGIFFLNPLLQTFLSVLNFLGNSFYYSIFTIGYSLLTITSSLLSIYIYKTSVYYWVIGSTFAQLIVLLLLIIFLINNKYLTLKESNLKEINSTFLRNIFKFSLPLLLTNVVLWVIFQLYKFKLPTLIGLHQTGIYFAGYGLASTFATILESFSYLIIWPVLFKKHERLDFDYNYEINQYIKFILNSLLLIFIVITIFGNYIIKLVLGDSFNSAYIFLILGFVIESMRVLINSFFIKFQIKNNTSPIFYYHLFIAFLFYLFLFVFNKKINVYVLVTSLTLSLIFSLIHFLYKNSKNEFSLNILFRFLFSLVVLYFFSLQTSIAFIIIKYLAGLLLVFIIINSNVKYLKKITTQNPKND
jgi:O-antigen/teichoic acid export membrane protein